MKRNSIFHCGLSLLPALALLLGLAACGVKSAATAATMHLRRTDGTVSVSDDGGKDVEPKDDLGLYSGYGVRTRSESYAWIDLDDVKLAKMDQDSRITIEKEGKELEIRLRSGNLFFNVTEPLEDDETMNIRTSTMLVGVRGTCGWVEELDDLSRVYILEGKVKCSSGDESVRVRAGEMAEATEDGKIAVTGFTVRDIPDFILEELLEDEDLAADILEDSGIDVLAPAESDPAADDLLVTDAYSFSFLYEGAYETLLFDYHIPQIHLDGEAAEALNRQLWDTYYREGNILIDPLPEGYAPGYGDPTLLRVSYEWYVNDSVFSLIVREDHNPLDWSGVFMSIYNFSLTTGEQLSDQQVLEALGYTEEDFYAGVRSALAAYWDETRVNYSDMLDNDAGFAAQFERCITDTLADSNVRASAPYVGEDGTLWFLGKTMWMAGSGSNVYCAPVG